MESNLVLARLSSQLLEQKCLNVESTLRAMASREVMAFDGKPRLPEVAAQPASPSAGSGKPVAQTGLEPLSGANSVEVYDAEGVRLASYAAARDANEIREIIRRIDSSRTGAFVELGKDGKEITLSAAIRANGKTQALGIASFPARVLANWLDPLWNATSRSISVIDGSAGVILSSEGGPPSGFSLADFLPAKKALEGPGTMKSAARSGGIGLFGYARTRVPGWAVLVSTPSRTGRIPMDFVAILLALLLIVLAVILIGFGLASNHPSTDQASPLRGSGSPDRGFSNTQVPQERPMKPPRSEPPDGSLTYDRSLLNRPPAPKRAVALPPAQPPADALAATGSISVQQGSWKCAAVSVRGRSHQKTGQQCQDASYCKVLDGNLLVGAVADGAGSASHGDLGARIAAKKAVDTLAEHAGNCLRSDDDEQWKRLLFSALDVARGNVEASAAGQNKATRQLATTLILFAATPNFITAAQIGDGAIVFQDAKGEIQALTSPQSGEYINTTTFLVSPDAFKSVQQKTWRGGYTSVAAFTDGLQMLALTIPGGVPHGQFFAPLFDFFETRDANETAIELERFLQSERITSRADDDLTLMLAALTP